MMLSEWMSMVKEGLKYSYAPYSGVKVSALAITPEGRVYRGVNVENASLGLTVCAERVAIFNAVSNGERRIKTIVITSNLDKPIYPCGACLQVMSEFGVEEVIIVHGNEVIRHSLKELFPRPFSDWRR
ncbi:MAG: cytidine deaminase [Vulcanisaeta sp.]|jgi:cytidine deaminase|nr:MAG: cytidine deaminase [Vulcanisaeta sp. OSP_8]MCG2864348.1 cytidine deaminase [Vulcanisaeta sp.]MCG2866082.1 cytidine deaminase [Vulcanisaeta sp.]MCG2884976.1 cytidine deaminase [Vulcanisaeta sp.]MDT7863070.1 cytidine deaminase [Vulcanisaeta sp.]